MPLLSRRSPARPDGPALIGGQEASIAGLNAGPAPLLLSLLVATQFTAFVDRNLSAALAPQLKASFHLTDAALGALQGPFFILLYTSASFAAGLAIHHGARLKIMVGCILTWTLGAVLFALAGSYAQLAVGRVLLGVGQAPFAAFALSVFAEGARGPTGARTLSAFTAGSSVGRSAAFVLAGAALWVVGVLNVEAGAAWRVVILAMVAPNLVLAALLAFASEPRPGRLATAPPYRAAFGWLRLQPFAATCVIVGAGAAVMSVQSLTAWGASVLHRQFGVAPAAAALGFGAALVPAALLGHLGGGWLIDRLKGGRWTPLHVLAAGLAVALAGVALSVVAGGPIIACAGLAVGALGASTASLAGMTAMQVMSPKGSKGALGAIFLGVTSLVGFGVGPLTAGLISDYRGSAPMALSASLLILITAAAAVGVLASLAGRKPWNEAVQAAKALDLV